MKVLNAVHSPITHRFFAENEELVKAHPVLQQFVGAVGDEEKRAARLAAEDKIYQFGLARIAALAIESGGFATPVDLKKNTKKIADIAAEIVKGLDDIARAYG